MCGGNTWTRRIESPARGPSPRVRGKLGDGLAGGDQPGSIPACAGETVRARPARCRAEVHPRVCGGNISSIFIARSRVGPSPRVRGKRVEAVNHGENFGSIPACAGETSRDRRFTLSSRVHPRVCGGNRRICPLSASLKGPSPRVRGKPGAVAASLTSGGSIPACAGETTSRLVGQDAVEVHPRVCGGNDRSVAQGLNLVGPSPRVRGKRRSTWRRWHPAGSIPACAGETSTPYRSGSP